VQQVCTSHRHRSATSSPTMHVNIGCPPRANHARRCARNVRLASARPALLARRAPTPVPGVLHRGRTPDREAALQGGASQRLWRQDPGTLPACTSRALRHPLPAQASISRSAAHACRMHAACRWVGPAPSTLSEGAGTPHVGIELTSSLSTDTCTPAQRCTWAPCFVARSCRSNCGPGTLPHRMVPSHAATRVAACAVPLRCAPLECGPLPALAQHLHSRAGPSRAPAPYTASHRRQCTHCHMPSCSECPH
jgi:hypothetical protein